MKRHLATVLALVTVTVCATIAWSQNTKKHLTPPGGTENGRYEVVAGTYRQMATIQGRSSSDDQKAVFRIDTQTGRTWVFVELTSDQAEAKSFMGWVPVEELPK